MKNPLLTSLKGSRSMPALPEEALSLAEKGALPRSTSVPFISPAKDDEARSEMALPRSASRSSSLPVEDEGLSERAQRGRGSPAPFRIDWSDGPSEKADRSADASDATPSAFSSNANAARDVPRNKRRSLPRYTAGDTDYEMKYAPDAYGKELGTDARVWKVYNDESQVADGEMVKELNGTTDVLLVFAGLFSAVVTTFLSQSSQSLSADYAQITANLVYELVHIQRAIAADSQVNDVPVSKLTPSSTTHSKTDLWVNGLWLISLTLSLLAALISVLAKQWIQHYNSVTGGTARERANIRHYRLLAFDRWHVPFIISFLPALLSMALLLFLGGLAVYFSPLDSTIAFVIIGFTSAIALLYVVSIILPIIITHCAYKTPVSNYIVLVAQFLARVFRMICSIASQIVRHRRVFWLVLDMPWSTHGLDLKAIERTEVARQEDTLITESLGWLCFSSLNSSAVSIAAQAISAYPKRLVLGSTLLNVCASAENAFQAVERKCRTSGSPLAEVDVAERLARALLHHPADPATLFGHVWHSQVWLDLYHDRTLIESPQSHVLLRLALLMRFGNDAGAMHDRSGLERLLYAVDLGSCEPPLSTMALHPVVWRELHRAIRLCILLFDERRLQGIDTDDAAGHGRRSRSSHSDRNSRVWDTYQQVRERRARLDTPPMTIRHDFPLDSTAITLEEYAIERRWEEGPGALLDGMKELKGLVSRQLKSRARRGRQRRGENASIFMASVNGTSGRRRDEAQGRGQGREDFSPFRSAELVILPSGSESSASAIVLAESAASSGGHASTNEHAHASDEAETAPTDRISLWTIVDGRNAAGRAVDTSADGDGGEDIGESDELR